MLMLHCIHTCFSPLLASQTQAEGAFRLAYEKTVSIGLRMDLCFAQIRVGKSQRLAVLHCYCYCYTVEIESRVHTTR